MTDSSLNIDVEQLLKLYLKSEFERTELQKQVEELKGILNNQCLENRLDTKYSNDQKFNLDSDKLQYLDRILSSINYELNNLEYWKDAFSDYTAVSQQVIDNLQSDLADALYDAKYWKDEFDGLSNLYEDQLNWEGKYHVLKEDFDYMAKDNFDLNLRNEELYQTIAQLRYEASSLDTKVKSLSFCIDEMLDESDKYFPNTKP